MFPRRIGHFVEIFEVLVSKLHIHQGTLVTDSLGHWHTKVRGEGYQGKVSCIICIYYRALVSALVRVHIHFIARCELIVSLSVVALYHDVPVIWRHISTYLLYSAFLTVFYSMVGMQTWSVRMSDDGP
jgi:hypothetical protein